MPTCQGGQCMSAYWLIHADSKAVAFQPVDECQQVDTCSFLATLGVLGHIGRPDQLSVHLPFSSNLPFSFNLPFSSNFFPIQTSTVAHGEIAEELLLIFSSLLHVATKVQKVILWHIELSPDRLVTSLFSRLFFL